jgi:hypothetical protein
MPITSRCFLGAGEGPPRPPGTAAAPRPPPAPLAAAGAAAPGAWPAGPRPGCAWAPGGCVWAGVWARVVPIHRTAAPVSASAVVRTDFDNLCIRSVLSASESGPNRITLLDSCIGIIIHQTGSGQGLSARSAVCLRGPTGRRWFACSHRARSPRGRTYLRRSLRECAAPLPRWPTHGR